MNPIRTTVIRVGQLAGGISGAWNISEWVPSMVKSGLVLKCLPSSEDVRLRRLTVSMRMFNTDHL